MISGKTKQEYFRRQVWAEVFALKTLANFVFRRERCLQADKASRRKS
jgi:hypothetical protein